MAEKKSNRVIAKNTMFLYFRMLVTMVISLFTSRVILQVLGVDDYGIYKAVGGIVGMLSFVNNALATSSSRFLTYGLGEGDESKLKRIFSTVLTAHVCLALIIMVLAETIGLWFLYNKMIIPPDRMGAAVYVFHISIITTFFTLTQVPYNASIIAHEKMTVYAYVSIVEAVLKLVIVYMLLIGNIDKLVLYATLLCLLSVGIRLFYRYYCSRRFKEISHKLTFDREIFKEIMSFSGWSLFSGASIALNNQGILILLNMFFAPAVVTARSISIQVNGLAHQFVSNFQTAANPQIVKRYAAGDQKGSKQLLLQTTRYSYYLMFILALPIFFAAHPMLELWLGIVPEYADVFLQLIVIQSLFQIFDSSFYRALYVKGQIKENALISPLLGFAQFPIVYILFRLGFSPIALSWASIVTYAILAFVAKPILVIRIANYTWKDILSALLPCLRVTVASIPLPLVIHFLLCHQSFGAFVSFVILGGVSALSAGLVIWTIGLSSETRHKILVAVRSRLHIKGKND